MAPKRVPSLGQKPGDDCKRGRMFKSNYIQQDKRVWNNEVKPITRLEVIATKYNTDKMHPHGYMQYYARHFDELSDKKIRLIEIGVASGASIRTWDEYFTHPDAEISGVDIDENCWHEISERAQVFIHDGTSTNIHGPFDIVIDDGSHVSEDILKAFKHIFPQVVAGGWYVVEDWAVQWRNDYGGDPTGSPAVRMVESLVATALAGDVSSVSEIHTYREILFIRKA